MGNPTSQWHGATPETTGAIVPPYPLGAGEDRPLARLRARSAGVRFVARDELDTLLSFATDTADPVAGGTTLDPGSARPQPVRIAIVDGVGGCGKTRLVAEVAARLADAGWHAGFLAEQPRPGAVRALAEVETPVLVVVDRAESTAGEVVADLVAALADRPAPSVVLLTARTRGQWWAGVRARLRAAGVVATIHGRMTLPARHPDPEALVRGSFRAYAGADVPDDLAAPAADVARTTLDLAMAGLVAAAGQRPAADHAALVDAVVDLELRYWADALAARSGRPAESSLRTVAACVGLLSPTVPELGGAELGGLLADAGVADAGVADVLAELLADTGGTLRLEPDPIADHLILTTLPTEPAAVAACAAAVGTAADTAVGTAAERLFDSLSRAGEPGDRSAPVAGAGATQVARELGTTVLRHRPDLWPAAYAVALRRGGALVAALEALAETDDTPLDLRRLAGEIPLDHATLGNLAVIAAERTRPDLPTDGDQEPSAEVARTLDRLGARLAGIGRGDDAIGPTNAAVTLYRGLVESDPGAFRGELAGALAALGVRLAGAGRGEQALAPSGEAVEVYRGLVESDPGAFRGELAGALAALGVRLAEVGRGEQALAPTGEAVEVYRELADRDPEEFHASLAGSLNNLALMLIDADRAEEALVPAGEAVELFRPLAEADPGRYLADLAGSLHNLGGLLMDLDRAEESVAPAGEAVELFRPLAEAQPGRFLADFAGSLNNLGVMLAATGQGDRAMIAAGEAIDVFRRLVENDPGAYLADLIGSLENLGAVLTEAGRGDEVLVAFERAWRGLGTGPLVELMVTRARWRRANGDHAGHVEDLRAAVEKAVAEEHPARGARARRIVRGALTAAGAEYPDAVRGAPTWVTCELPGAVIEVVERAAATRTWDEAAAVLRSPDASGLLEPEQRPVRAAMAALFADQPAFVKVLRVLDAADQHGLDTVLDDLCGSEQHALDLRGWLATPTWADSHRYLAGHRDLLDDPRTLAALTESENARMRQHAAIVRLATVGGMSLDEVYAVVMDLDVAVDTILAAIETGDQERIIAVFHASPLIGQEPFVAAYTMAVLSVLDDDLDQARKAVGEAAANATETDREAGVQRLLRLAGTAPERAAALRELAELLAEPAC